MPKEATDRETWQRARRPAEQAARRTAIVDGARELLRTATTPEGISTAALARSAGVSAATMYTYFSGRDAILLTATGHELGDWMADLTHRLAAEHLDLDTVADHTSRSLDAHPSARRLLPALPSLLAGANPTEAHDAKAELGRQVRSLAAAIEHSLPTVDGERAVRALRALVVGLWSFATEHPADPDVEEIEWFRKEFGASFRAVLIGLGAERDA